jgi:hypothetical protein
MHNGAGLKKEVKDIIWCTVDLAYSLVISNRDYSLSSGAVYLMHIAQWFWFSL